MSNLTPTTFEPIQQRFTSLLPPERFQKEVAFAVQIFNSNSYLNKATPESKLKAVYNVALTGLTLDPQKKLAYLVPRRVNNQIEACLEPSYQGVAKLVLDAGKVSSIECHVVYECDEFEYTLGLNPNIIHKPCGKKGSPITHAYMIGWLKEGRPMIEVMTIDELNEVRETSDSWKSFKAGKSKSCIWNSWEGEMYRKTVLKRGCKYLPKGDNEERLETAIELTNTDFTATTSQVDYINQLLETASIEIHQKEQIQREVNTYSSTRAGDCIKWLQESQNEESASDEILGMVDDLLEKAKHRLNKSEYRSTELAIERGMTAVSANALISWLSTKVEPIKSVGS